MEEEKKKKITVGKASSDLLQKTPDTLDPIELQRAMHQDYESHIHAAVLEGKKKFSGDFYIAIDTKKERLMQNVLRNYFIIRETCPRPFYDQTIYHYDKLSDMLEFLWVIPSKDTCELFRSNALQIVPEEKELLKFVLEFYDGTLDIQSKKLNKELYG